MAVNPIPAGYHSVTPCLIIADPRQQIQFMREAFSASIKEISEGPGGTVMHATIWIGDTIVMLGPASPNHPPLASMLYVYVPDVDSVYASALAAGGSSLQAPADQFYGDRVSGVSDPAGNQWWIATHIEDVTPEETARRFAAMGSQHGVEHST
jgi:PhnB protein